MRLAFAFLLVFIGLATSWAIVWFVTPTEAQRIASVKRKYELVEERLRRPEMIEHLKREWDRYRKPVEKVSK